MLLRKSRKHLHGSSNRTNTDATFHNSFYRAFSHTKKEPLPKNPATPSTSYLKYRRFHKKENSFKQNNLHTHPEESDSQQTEIEYKLRKIYQGRKNIVKAIDGWAFDAKGFISKQAFKLKLAQKLGTQPTEKQVSSLLLKYAGNESGINAYQLISLIHNKTEGSMFNETLFAFEQPSKLRDLKIDNLKQNLKVYAKTQSAEFGFSQIDQLLFKINSSISKIRHKSNSNLLATKEQFFNQLLQSYQYGQTQKNVLRNIQKTIDYNQLKYNIQTHKTVDHLFFDPILRKTYASIQKNTEGNEENNDLFLDRMIKTSANSSKLLRKSQKKFDYDPSSMLNINQQKTRFGKHFPTKQDYNEPALTLNQGVGPNQKDLILKTIKSQSDIQKQRYANKLEKIRQFQQSQQQSIARKEQGALEKDQCRLRRIRHEQQAYNYVNFIKKKWQ